MKRSIPLLFNVGSLNLDYVYTVPRFVAPGETLSSSQFATYTGGKGLNQSIAMARAGVPVSHFGAVGAEGGFLRETLVKAGVDTEWLRTVESPSGHAMIQVVAGEDNAILLHGGANHQLAESELKDALDTLPDGAFVLTQNETNLTAFTIQEAHRRGLTVVWNPAPMDSACLGIALSQVDYLVVNESEAIALCGGEGTDARALGLRLAEAVDGGTVIVTLGASGCLAVSDGVVLEMEAAPVDQVVDTTAAGDTFIGFFLAERARGQPLEGALRRATRAAAWCVQRSGAEPSIPKAEDLTEESIL